MQPNPYSRLGAPQRPAQSRRLSRALKTPQARASVFAVGTGLALAFAMMWNPPTGSIHSFTAASDYKASKDSGCTNSGGGCHGKEASYTDFNAYHPETECTTCHEYDGVGCIPCHAPRGHECTECHDGSMDGVTDAVRLTDSYPNGHYRETSHTADIASMKRVVKASESGEAQAQCKDCHSADLRKAHTDIKPAAGSTYGPEIGCGECHNDVGTFGEVEVVSDWKNRRCESCHKAKSKSPWHGVDALPAVDAKDGMGCGDSGQGCHESADLHELHVNKPTSCTGSAEGEPGCHGSGKGDRLVAARGCGGTADDSCHRASDGADYQHENMAVHSPRSAAEGADTSYYDTACNRCHDMATNGVSGFVEHASDARLGEDRGACRGCHNHASSQDALASATFACDACHGNGLLPPAHSADMLAVHDARSGSGGCAATGPGCHGGANLFAVGDEPDALHSGCLRCHDRTASQGNLPFDPEAKSCGSERACHEVTGEFDPDSGRHTIDGARVGGNDTNHHTAGAPQGVATYRDLTTGAITTCSTCHSMVLGTEHARPNASVATGTLCLSCHNANDTSVQTVRGSWPSRLTATACSECHNGAPGTPEPHHGIEAVHAGVELSPSSEAVPGTCVRSGCHPTTDLRALHANKGCALAECHSATGDIRSTRRVSCGGADGGPSCHTSSQQHLPVDGRHQATEISKTGASAPGTCARAGCHSTVDVRSLHTALSCATPGCHVEGGPTFMSCGGPDGQAACHTSSQRHANYNESHQATELDSADAPAPGGCAKPGCHATKDVRVLHKTLSCATPGCHVEGGPTHMSCGGSATNTLSCHVSGKRHGDITAKHVANEYNTSGAAQAGACASSGCHTTTNARTLHSGVGCYIAGCHVEGGPTYMSCGGKSGDARCHVSFSQSQHFQSHDASLTGTVNGVSYGPGGNAGCLEPCHSADLIAEHSAAAGQMEGTSATVCRVCHYDPADSGSGTFSVTTSVVSAIAGNDRRCISCHSGTPSSDGGGAVASPPATCMPLPSMVPSQEVASTAPIAGRALGTLSGESGDAEAGETLHGRRADRGSGGPKTPESSDATDTARGDEGSARERPDGRDDTDSPKEKRPKPERGPDGDKPDSPSADKANEPAPKSECPCGASGSDNAPELDDGEADKPVCLKCHDLKAEAAEASASGEGN